MSGSRRGSRRVFRSGRPRKRDAPENALRFLVPQKGGIPCSSEIVLLRVCAFPKMHTKDQIRSASASTEAATAPARKFSKARPLARQVGLHPKTLFRLADAGKISAYRVNARLVLFDEAEVVALIEAGRTGGREQ